MTPPLPVATLATTSDGGPTRGDGPHPKEHSQALGSGRGSGPIRRTGRLCAGSAVRFWNWHRTTLTPRPSWTLLNAELLVHDAEKRIVPMTRSRKLTLATLLGLALSVVAVDDQRAANRLAVVFKDGEEIARTYTDGDGHFQVIFRIEEFNTIFFLK